MHTLRLCTRLDPNINAGAVFLHYNVYIRGGISSGHLTVSADIVCALRHLVQAGHLFQQFLLYCVHSSLHDSTLQRMPHIRHSLTRILSRCYSLSLKVLQGCPVPKRSGMISSLLPTFSTLPSDKSTI